MVNNLSTITRRSQATNPGSSGGVNQSSMQQAWDDVASSNQREEGVVSPTTTRSTPSVDNSDLEAHITPVQNRFRTLPIDGNFSEFDSLGRTDPQVYTMPLPGTPDPSVSGLLTGLPLITDNNIETIYNTIANNIKKMQERNIKPTEIATQGLLELQNSQLTIDQLKQLYNKFKEDSMRVFPGIKPRLLTSIEKSIINKICDNISFEIGANVTKIKRSDDDMKDAMFQYIVECMRQGGSMKEVSTVMDRLREAPYNLELNNNDWLTLFNKYCKDSTPVAAEGEQLINTLKGWLDKLNIVRSDGRVHIDCSAANALITSDELTQRLNNSTAMQDSKFAAVAYYMVYNIVQENSADDITNNLMALSQNISSKLSLDATSFKPEFASSQPVVLPESPKQGSASNILVEPEEHMKKTAVEEIGNFSPRPKNPR